MALELDIKTIDKKTLQATISELLNNKKYTDAARLRSKNFQDQKEKPIERALWWVDYVARNPDVSFLKNPKLARMNYITKHSIDVIAVLTVILLAIILGTCKVVCIIRKKRRSAKNGKVKRN